MPNNDITSGLYASLAKVGSFFAEKMKQKISDVNAPKKIAKYTSVESPVVNDEGGYVDIVIDTSEDGAPMAGAYEWGKEPYRIPPEGTRDMKFPKEKWPTFDETKWGNRAVPKIFVFTHVNHPAIVPRPYIEPTIRENLPEIKRMLAQDFKQAIISGIEKRVVIE